MIFYHKMTDSKLKAIKVMEAHRFERNPDYFQKRDHTSHWTHKKIKCLGLEETWGNDLTLLHTLETKVWRPRNVCVLKFVCFAF